MAVESSALNFNQPTPPVVKPLSEIAGVSNLGAQLMGAPDGAQARALIGTDQPTDPRPPSTHDHDGRYYTETESDALLAGKAAAVHNHDTTYYTKAQVDAAVAAVGRRKVTALMTGPNPCEGFAVITSDDQILVWGVWQGATLSQNETASGIPRPLKLNGVKTGTWVKVIANKYNVFAVTSTGELWGMGDNTVGQLGLGDTTNTGTRQRLLHRINVVGKAVSNVVMAQSTSTYLSVYAICTDGTLYSWGWNVNGQLGINNTTDASSPQFVVIPAASVGSSVVEVSAVGQVNAGVVSPYWSTSVIVRTSDNKIHVCGANATGQLGLGDQVQRNQLVNVSGKLASKVQMCGYSTGAAVPLIFCQIITTSGSLQSAGYNGDGQLGNNSVTLSTTFINTSLNHTNVASLAINISQIQEAGYVTTTGIVWLVGNNGVGTLGNGGTTQSLVYVQPSGACQGYITKAIIVNRTLFVLAVVSGAGEVWTCGLNTVGECGDGLATNRSTLFKAALPENIIDIGAGSSNANNTLYALGASGRLYSSGLGSGGQSGQGVLGNSRVFNECLI